MYLCNFPSNKIETIKNDVFSDKEYLDIYNRLKNDEFTLYFKYNSSDGSISYYAINKCESYPKCLVFTLSVDKNISNLYPNSINNKTIAYSFVYFIYENDNKATDEKLMNRYGSTYSLMCNLAKLNSEQAKRYIKAKSSLNKLSQDLLKSITSSQKERINVTYNFSNLRGDYYEVFISIGIEHKYKCTVRNMNDFLDNVFNENDIYCRNLTLEAGTYEFSENDLSLFSFLNNHCLNLYTYGDGTLSESNFVNFLFLAKENEIKIDNVKYKINETIEGKVSLGEDGKILLSRPLENDEYFLSNEKNIAIINKDTHLITLLTFNNVSAYKLYKFALEENDFPYELVGDDISKSIVPLINNEVEINNNFLEKHHSERSQIVYQINYLESEALELATKYYFGLNEVSYDDFVNNSELNKIKFNRFNNELSKLNLQCDGLITNQKVILSFIQSDLKDLANSCKLLLSENLVNKKTDKLGKINVVTKSGEDWFSLSLVSKNYSKDELDSIFNAYKKHKKFIHLRGSFLILDEKNNINEVAKEFANEDLGEKLPIYKVFKLNLQSEKDLTMSDSLMKLINDISNYKNNSLTNLSPSLLSILRPYQKDGVKWLLARDKYNLGGVLADEMGLGKTLQTIAFLSICKDNGPVLIVSPKSLIYNWESEFSRFDKSRKVHIINGNINEREKIIDLAKIDKENSIFVISYDSLRNDIEKLKDIGFAYLFLDEAQYIANAFAKKSKAVKSIKAIHRFVLTGTPIQNSLLDLWSIFDFLMPGYFPSYKDFKLEYGGFEYADIDSENKLRYKVMPFILKRNKSDVLKELPPKEEFNILVNLNDEQRKIYESYLYKTREFLKGTKERKNSNTNERSNKIAVLAMLTRLREICVDPSMFLDYNGESEKISNLIETIQIAINNGHKILIFSSFVKALNNLKNKLNKIHINSDLIYGDVSAKERIRMANEFNSSDDVKVMLVSLKAGGTGLNLVGADLVYHLDPWWNVAAENQASDRAHRIGQTRKVSIYKMIAKNTIEEKVINLQDKKKNLTNILANDDKSLTSLSYEDIAYLLS